MVLSSHCPAAVPVVRGVSERGGKLLHLALTVLQIRLQRWCFSGGSRRLRLEAQNLRPRERNASRAFFVLEHPYFLPLLCLLTVHLFHRALDTRTHQLGQLLRSGGLQSAQRALHLL